MSALGHFPETPAIFSEAQKEELLEKQTSFLLYRFGPSSKQNERVNVASSSKNSVAKASHQRLSLSCKETDCLLNRQEWEISQRGKKKKKENPEKRIKKGNPVTRADGCGCSRKRWAGVRSLFKLIASSGDQIPTR